MAESEITAEEWRVIPGHERYEVSDQGRVRRLAGGMGARPGRLLKPQILPNGYPAVSMGRRPDGHNKAPAAIHTLVLTAFVGPRLPGTVARHLDGVRSHSYLSNLAWGTYSENSADRNLHGTANKGSRHGMAKLNEDAVRTMRREYGAGTATSKALARRFGVCQSVAYEAICGRSWGHVE